MVTAKGAILTGLNQPFQIEELVWDEPRDNEVAVQVVASGVCHTDWHCVVGDYAVEYPILVGHEGVGIITKIGKNVTRVKVGDHIVLSWMDACGHCPWCVKGLGQLCDNGAHLLDGARDDGTFRVHTKDGKDCWQFGYVGTFSEYIVVPEGCCIKVDNEIPLEKGSHHCLPHPYGLGLGNPYRGGKTWLYSSGSWSGWRWHECYSRT